MRLITTADEELWREHMLVPCDPVTTFTSDLAEDLVEMRKILDKERGLGLAANQVGLTHRICLVRDHPNDVPIYMVNPMAFSYETDETEMGVESCLSIPGRHFLIRRPKSILVSYQSALGKDNIMWASGLLARVVLHELDHLDGITLIERVELGANKLDTAFIIGE